MDLLYLSTYVFLGIMLINNSSISYAINKGALSLSNASWIGMAEMTFILAVNRFIVMLGVDLPHWFNEKMLHHPNGQFALEAGNDFISVKNILYLQEEVMLVLICMMFVLYAIVIIGMVIQGDPINERSL
uniref:NADH dehydrogenase subunit 6 n=1 Tax=Acrobeloides nanus TaxID=290746 RepID=A0A914EG00_9BILA